MIYLFIPIGLVSILIVYALYLLLFKKDLKKFRSVLYLALLFIGIWAVVYYLILK